MWVPEWGLRPDQVGCAAPKHLLEDYGIQPPRAAKFEDQGLLLRKDF